MTADHAPHQQEPDSVGHASVPPQSAGDAPPPAPAPHDAFTARTRLRGLWAAIGSFALILVFLLIFILQNGSTVHISYLSLHSQLPLGVAMLFAALAGIVLTVLAGTARILQLRAAARRRTKH